MSLTINIVAYYKLDESTGTTCVDTVNGYSASDHGAVGSASGIISNAAVFNGANYLVAADTADLRFTGPFTVAGWFKVTTDTSGGAVVLVGKIAGGGLDQVGDVGVQVPLLSPQRGVAEDRADHLPRDPPRRRCAWRTSAGTPGSSPPRPRRGRRAA
jgi:hypothetical protein